MSSSIPISSLRKQYFYYRRDSTATALLNYRKYYKVELSIKYAKNKELRKGREGTIFLVYDVS